MRGILAAMAVLASTAIAGGAGAALATVKTADAQGSWNSVSPLAAARAFHTATLLSDGRVLVTGGVTRGGLPHVLASTAIYDPRTRTWTSGVPLKRARSHQTATAIGGFKVLVAGGIDATYSSTASAEIYDTRARTWTTVAAMVHRRYDQTATLLPDGSVLVVGGTQLSTKLSSVEQFNPGTGEWSPLGAPPSLATGRSNHTATLMGNGKVLVVGGTGAHGVLASAQIYDPTCCPGSWSGAPSMRAARTGATAVLLTDGRVLVMGGVDGRGKPVLSAEAYNPSRKTWAAAGTLAVGGSGGTATLLDSGAVLLLVAGHAQLFDPRTSSWGDVTGAGRLPISGQTATLLANGYVLVTGGMVGGEVTSQAWERVPELVDVPASTTPTPSATPSAVPSGGTFSPAPRTDAVRYGHTATLLKNGRVLVAGGAGGPLTSLYGPPPPGILSSAQLYIPDKNAWESAGSMSIPRYHQTATLLNDGRVLVTGGVTPTGAVASAELYDPSSNAWKAAAPMHDPRDGHTATLLKDGRVLVAGGHTDNGGALATVEIYNPPANSWSTAAPMIAGRYFHDATLLGNGQVLVEGGAWALASAETYDPSTNSWTLAGSMTVGRVLHTATLLASGEVLVAGGLNGLGALASTELYDPVNNLWTMSGSMSVARWGQTSTLLPNGFVYGICGGGPGEADASVEVYDPATGKWSPAVGGQGASPAGHTATVLPSGELLVVGGTTSSGAVSGSTIFRPPGFTFQTLTGAAPSGPSLPLIVIVIAAVLFALGLVTAFLLSRERR